MSEQPVWINNNPSFTLIPRIRDTSERDVFAEVIGKPGKRANSFKDDFILLQPGEATKVLVINEGRHSGASTIGKYNLLKGAYIIFVLYENISYERREKWEPGLSGKEYGINAWIGTLTSNAIIIEVR